VVWTQGEDAIFGATADAAISVTSAITVDDITFGSSQTIDAAGAGAFTLADATSNMTVSNSADTATIAETITGVVGRGITKLGPGTLTLSGANTYLGVTTISAGTLKLGDGSALGTSAGTTTVSSGAVLDLNGQTSGETINLSGTGISSNGALVNSGAAGSITARIDVSASSIGGSGDILLSGGITGSGSSFTKVGANKVTIQTGATGRNNGASSTSVNGGVLRIENASGLDTANTLVTINSAALELGSGITYVDTVGFLLNNGATLRGDGAVNINSKVTVSTAVSANSVTLATVGAGDLFTVGSAANDITGGNSTDDTIHIAGPGKVILGQSSNYIGNWSLDAGTTQLGSATALGATAARTVSLATGATLAGRLAANTTFTANPITVSGTGTATIQHDRSSSGAGVVYTFGTLGIGSQTLAVNSVSGGNVTNNTSYGITLGATTLSGNSIFDVANNGSGTGTLTLASVTSPAGTSLTKNGNGALTVTAAAPNIGWLIYNAGALNLSGTLTLGSNTTTALTMRDTTINNNITLAGAFADDDFVFDATNNGTATLGGTVDIGNRSTVWNIGNGSATTDMQITGGITGTGGSVTKTGAGLLLLASANSYTGLTSVLAGTLAEGASGSIANTSALTVNGATAVFDLGFNHSDTVATVTLDGGGLISGTGTSALTVNSPDTYEMMFGTASAILAGSATLNKTTASMVTISGDNTYSGATNVNGGILVVNGNQAAATGDVTVLAGATLAGLGTIGGNTTILGTHSPGNSPGIQSFAGNLTYSGGASDVDWELINDTVINAADPNAVFDTIEVGVNLDFADPTALNLTFNSAGSLVDWNDIFWASSHLGTNGWLVYDVAGTTSNFGNLTVTLNNWADGNGALLNTVRPGWAFTLTQEGEDVYLNYIQLLTVPEPSSALLLGVGALAMMLFIWSRKGRAARASL